MIFIIIDKDLNVRKMTRGDWNGWWPDDNHYWEMVVHDEGEVEYFYYKDTWQSNMPSRVDQKLPHEVPKHIMDLFKHANLLL